MAKACKACAAAIKGTKKMAKSRKSSKNLVMDGLYITGGVVAGGYAVPKVVEMIDPNGKLDPKLTQGIAAAGGFFGAMNTKGTAQKVLLGVGIGAAANLLSEVVGMGYVVNPNTNLENIIGYGEGNAPDSRYNAGEL